MSSSIFEELFPSALFSESCKYNFTKDAIDNLKTGKLKIVVKKRGNNLTVIVENISGYFVLYIGGDNNTLVLRSGVKGSYDLRVWRDSLININNNTTSNGIRVECDKSSFIVGKDCMFSDSILVQTSDQHGIIDLDSKKIVNIGHKTVELKDHVWIGRSATLTSNVCIEHGSIVGTGSIVTSNIPAFSIAAGVPARVIRSNHTWSRYPERFCEYSQEIILDS